MSNRIYCLHCKQQTDTENIIVTKMKNGTPVRKGICKICGTKKNQIIKHGGSILNAALNKLPLPEMHMRLPADVPSEYVPNGSFNNTGKYSFCGPFTKLSKRLAEGYQGVNSLDKACKTHDIAYATYADTKSRNVADDILAAEASKIALGPDVAEYEKKHARTVTAIMAAKSRFGLGLKKR